MCAAEVCQPIGAITHLRMLSALDMRIRRQRREASTYEVRDKGDWLAVKVAPLQCLAVADEGVIGDGVHLPLQNRQGVVQRILDSPNHLKYSRKMSVWNTMPAIGKISIACMVAPT